ncbi:mucoidy inhibitor MuiA family protein [Myxococcus sp. AB025B]|uniref:mucoidy inhibitor MuiA family protein n=1 Tax=Myxococcus sp. AB025B TaxID=2562794 RepID=UPI0011419607|nr:mucoidy inhibitor MuiA family protein [Myxococcus sp. AB025B]
MTLFPLSLLVLAAAPQVSSVVVYPDRAHVTRTQDVTCRGPTTAVFEHVPEAASRESFRARAPGADLEGLTAERQTLEQQLSAERREWRARWDALTQEELTLDAALARVTGLERLSEGYTDVAVDHVTRELTGRKPDTRAWASAFDAALSVRMRAVREAWELAEKRRALKQRRDEVSAQLSRLSTEAARAEYRVEVRLSCPEGKKARVSLTYLVGGSSWEPSYEARADEASGTVELTALATVRQQTGEDWSGAKLVLSTALPRKNATPPEMAPLLVRALKQPKERQVLTARQEARQSVEGGVEGAASSGEGPRVVSHGVSVQWEAEEATRVPGDGVAVRVVLGRHRLPAEFSWRTVPKLHPVVFRVARLANTTSFPLLPGEVSLFRGTGFLGRQRLERVASGLAFELTFGIEEALRVTRTTVEEVKRPQGLFGGKQRFRYAYRFQLSNLRQREEKVVLSEHIPVSELDDVKVEVAPESTAGLALTKDDGIATWQVALAPAETRTLELVFHVDAPSSYVSGGL